MMSALVYVMWNHRVMPCVQHLPIPRFPAWSRCFLSELSLKGLHDLAEGGHGCRDGKRNPHLERFMVEVRRHSLPTMELTTILNPCHRFRGFVYQHARFIADKKSIEVAVRQRKDSAAVCSRCHLRRPVTTNSPNGALSSFPSGVFSSSFCTPCGALTVAAVVL
jgi:hypothetical protein